MAILPTRTSSDTNSAADVNDLSTESLDKGGTGQLSALTEDAAPASGGLFLYETAAGALRKVDYDNMPGSSAVGSTEMNPMFAAGSFDYPTSNPAPLDTDSGANGTIKRQLFDDSTDESVIGQFKVPSDINTSGTVTFRMYGYAVTAGTDKDVVFDFKHSAGGDSDTWDAAFTTESSGALRCDNIQDDIDVFSWTETVSNLGWSASDFCRFQLTRDADNGSDNLTGDYGVIFFEIDIPRA